MIYKLNKQEILEEGIFKDVTRGLGRTVRKTGKLTHQGLIAGKKGYDKVQEIRKIPPTLIKKGLSQGKDVLAAGYKNFKDGFNEPV